MKGARLRSDRVKRGMIYSILTSLVFVTLLPRSALATGLAVTGAWAGILCGAFYALTFWSKVRIRIGRLGLRYKVVRRSAAWISAIGLSYLLTVSISLAIRTEPSSVGSSATKDDASAVIDPEEAVVRCFCDTLSAERKTEAREHSGVATTVWPNYDDVEACVERVSRVDKQRAEEAWDSQRWSALDLNVHEDSRAICRAAGMAFYEGEPPPAGPEVMQQARDEVCREEAELQNNPGSVPSYDPEHPKTSIQAIKEWGDRYDANVDAELAARFHISVNQADAALKRAGAERMLANHFLCLGEEPAPTEAQLEAKPTNDEIASARSALCHAAREHPDDELPGGMTERAIRIYETSTSTRLAHDRAPLVVSKAVNELGGVDGFQHGEPLRGEQVIENDCN
jgi:hypothetical protein